MKTKLFIYCLIFGLLLFSINNIIQYSHKKVAYNKALNEYSSLKTTYDENIKKMKQLGTGDNKARYFREQYNISKNDEILFKLPEDYENTSS